MAAQIATSVGVTTLFHPVGYAKVLIQIGHEPLEPCLAKKWFGLGKQEYCYPNIFKYIGHIYSTDGFFGLYRGLGARIIGSCTASFVEKSVLKAVRSCGLTAQTEQTEESKDELIVWAKDFIKQTSEEIFGKCCAILASQPLHVIMIRQMAQFVGGEREYNTVFSSIAEIYRNDGILGFFAGVIPRVLGEMMVIFLTNFASQLFNKYFVEDKELQTYCTSGFGLFFGQFVYPFQLVGNVMAVNNSGLVVSHYPYMSPYKSWLECWSSLKSKNQLSRGSSIFLRYMKGNPVISPSVYTASSKRY